MTEDEIHAAARDPVAALAKLGIPTDDLPEHMREGFALWLLAGVYPGRFGTAVIHGDLFGALGHADSINQARLHSICAWLYTKAPAGSYGSAVKAENWARQGGIIGRMKAAQVPQ